MTTSYPGTIDNFINPASSDALGSTTVPHANQHDNINDSVKAIEVELGVLPKGTFTNVTTRLNSLAPIASPSFTGTATFSGSMADPSLSGAYCLLSSSDAFTVLGRASGPLVFRVRGAASQTGDLQRWEDVSGNVLASVGANGIIATGGVAGVPTIASATTIAPVKQISFVSGVTSIATITPPAPIATIGGSITIIPTGLFSTTTAGNIALASTAIVNRTLVLTYDPITAKWYPSY